jgi:hypothetical protein
MGRVRNAYREARAHERNALSCLSVTGSFLTLTIFFFCSFQNSSQTVLQENHSIPSTGGGILVEKSIAVISAIASVCQLFIYSNYPLTSRSSSSERAACLEKGDMRTTVWAVPADKSITLLGCWSLFRRAVSALVRSLCSFSEAEEEGEDEEKRSLLRD